ncbi:imidazole glycerol phosphate synthase subunit HisH [Paracrocinitomix mangrovi]|uniref:imidazole glycerol phosphate synthase subunit HisH n=1 Tax=Paracrocinitomix mangrovi TaxID=2862509 RepID=UPI001C8D6C69|nr:imidazole glycerol phosphate synthase subunit HisH [Paracrocinitomix mangrovi]UKN02294.1 imidazole glycerol phosphate synthase subunit HisH [Paracrocinitomix mangrovi]
MKLVIIDYGAGNVKSVQFAFERLGVDVELTDDFEMIRKADGVVFPGVGHAQFAMNALQEKGLDALIPSLKQPVLGICLGMQLLCQNTAEGDVKGLGVFDVSVEKFKDNLKVPKIGWNKLNATENELFKDLSKEAFFYFVHSYYVPTNPFEIAAATYGNSYSASICKDNFYACQFHPEKSGVEGEQVLKNFIELCELYQP